MNVYTVVEAEGTRPWKIIGAKQMDIVGSAKTLDGAVKICETLNDPKRMED